MKKTKISIKRPVSPPTSSSPRNTSLPQFLNTSLPLLRGKYNQILEHEHAIASKPDAIPTHPISHRLDRYPDIKPWAHNRVHLKCLSYPYINASPITLGRAHETFIATQGPLETDSSHFWRMCWQERCEIIIMLTQAVERGVEKCGVYYPEDEGEEKVLDGEWGSVKCVSKSMKCGSEVRELMVKKNGEEEERKVYHFLFLAWPDHDVPKTEEEQKDLLELVKMSRFRIDESKGEEVKESLPPRIVHCSAGVGRTGTFIVLDYLLQELKEGKLEYLMNEGEGKDPIFETVKTLREQRMGLVYKFAQYAFIYQIMREKWLVRMKRDESPVVRKRSVVEMEQPESPTKKRKFGQEENGGAEDAEGASEHEESK